MTRLAFVFAGVIMAGVSFSQLTYTKRGNSTWIEGVLERPLVVRDQSNLVVRVSGQFPILLERVKHVKVVDTAISTFGKPLEINFSEDVVIEDSRFDAKGADADAAIVQGNTKLHRWQHSFSSYDDVWGIEKKWDVKKLKQGRPDLVDSKKNWKWFSTTSYRTKKEIWYGYDESTYSRDIVFRRCEFLNAKRAGLFIHHTVGFVVENCFSDHGEVVTNEYDLGAEWTANGVFRNNIVTGPGIWSHYHAMNIRFVGNSVKNGTIQVMSQGEPVRDILIQDNVAQGVRIWNGQVHDWNSAGWIENVLVKGGRYGYVWMASGQVNGGGPEVLMKNIELRDVIVDWKRELYPVAVRTESVDGFLMSGVKILGGGVYQDFDTGARVKTRLMSDGF